MKKIYVIWIWWIWISWIARYYNENWYQVFWSDKTDSELIHKLRSEWIDIIIWEDNKRIDETFEKVIYTEAIPKTQIELKKAQDLNLKVLTYPESLAEVANAKKLVTIAWTHWKSTTTSMTSLVLKNSDFKVNALVWTLLREFSWKNTYFSNSDFFVLEACEYKRSFLAYKPFIWVITNIDLDHLDYYKDLEDYISAFRSYVENIIPWWYLVIDGNEENSKKLLWVRSDINYVLVYEDRFEILISDSSPEGEEKFPLLQERARVRTKFPTLNLQIPWSHILYDAHLAYVVWKIIWVSEKEIVSSLENYAWAWRRSEIIWITKNENILMSDYGHHPTEIKVTLNALKWKYSDKKLFVVFQPHQYNRTLELLEEFKNSFFDADILVTPDIYYSRDSKADMEAINWEKFINAINHPNKIFWDWLQNSLKLINKYDEENSWKLVIILLWAWNVDDLRYEIETK